MNRQDFGFFHRLRMRWAEVDMRVLDCRDGLLYFSLYVIYKLKIQKNLASK